MDLAVNAHVDACDVWPCELLLFVRTTCQNNMGTGNAMGNSRLEQARDWWCRCS